MRCLICVLLLVGGVWGGMPGAAPAGQLPPPEAGLMTDGRPLRVGLVIAPPFLDRNGDGQYEGVAFDLWTDVARDLGVSWKAEEYDLESLLAAVREGTVDVAVSALSITPDREAVMDFSQPFFYTGLGIAVSARSGDGLGGRVARAVFATPLLLYVGALVLLLLVVGTVIWAIERRRNPAHFRPGGKGIGDGVWWSAVTMTSVGYGDMIPKSLVGRAVALVWMFASVVLLATFTAGITSSLTVETMTGAVHGPEDLHKIRTGVVGDSAADEALTASHVGVRRYGDAENGLKALVQGELDAFVHDQPLLQYCQHRRYEGQIRILPIFFDPQLYGFAFPRGAALRKSVNVAMLRRLEDAAYRRNLLAPYLGRAAIR